MGFLHSFSIKNIFYDKMGLRLFYVHMTIYRLINYLTGFFLFLKILLTEGRPRKIAKLKKKLSNFIYLKCDMINLIQTYLMFYRNFEILLFVFYQQCVYSLLSPPNQITRMLRLCRSQAEAFQIFCNNLRVILDINRQQI